MIKKLEDKIENLLNIIFIDHGSLTLFCLFVLIFLSFIGSLKKDQTTVCLTRDQILIINSGHAKFDFNNKCLIWETNK